MRGLGGASGVCWEEGAGGFGSVWKERPEKTDSVISMEVCLNAVRGDEVGEWSWMEELWVGRAGWMTGWVGGGVLIGGGREGVVRTNEIRKYGTGEGG